MFEWLENWNEKVQNTPPITTSVWSVDVPLYFRKVSDISPFEVIRASSSRLAEVLRLHTLGTSFICAHEEDESAYREETNESIYIWPSRWSVVARDADQALRRFEDFRTLVDEIALFDEWIPRIKMGSRMDSEFFSCTERTFVSADLVTNHPLHSYWLDDEIDTLDLKLAIGQLARLREIRGLEIRTSTVLEAKRSLEALVNLLPLVEIDTYNWKWVILAAHNSLQNFMVAALEGTSPGRVLVETRQSLSGSNSSIHGDSTLIKFLDLYDRVKKDLFVMQNMNSKKYTAVGNVGNSVKRLNDLRNGFAHFDPKTLVLSYESVLTLPRMLEDIFNIIEFMAFESHNVRWSVYPIEHVVTKLIMVEVRGILEDLAEQYWHKNQDLKLGLKMKHLRLASNLTSEPV